MGYVIQIIFGPNTRQLGGGGGLKVEVGDPKVIHGSFLDHSAQCTSDNMPLLFSSCGSILCAFA